jgi:hypothetical protein
MALLHLKSLMVRSAKRVSNHVARLGPSSFETALTRLLRMRSDRYDAITSA